MNDLKKQIVGYVAGFVASIAITLCAYFLVVSHAWDNWIIFAAISALAILQFVVQLHFFTHFGSETKPRWKVIAFYFMLVVVIIVVLGSLWIMASLNYNMSANHVNTYMRTQDGF